MGSVHICLRSFIVDGALGGVRPGMSRGQVRGLLGPPDEVSSRGAAIWRYGNFEVHFEDDGAFLLFTDYVHCLDAGPGRTLDRWIAADSSFSKEETLSRLATHGVPYQLLDGGAFGTIARVADGADLSFHPVDKYGPPTEWTSLCVLAPHMRKPYRPLLDGTAAAAASSQLRAIAANPSI